MLSEPICPKTAASVVGFGLTPVAYTLAPGIDTLAKAVTNGARTIASAST